ncbi:Heterodisulfide reductase, subunit A-like protein [uncultured Desulfobacterium sp.]|uniref:Heterodisulfide reductase, subunit A-like protein n=1 Tax=uncultured Desulfobacterium sp. TaxID=201089 RepID=A0A445N0R4_9BACT|nr:Heterodisulfide reductase, subunit A-like protein [uncultured Desulfobacterium sp.]
MAKKSIGSVMVIGGGIAGIQSALDLADSGFLVHMVEKTPAIGGVMSALDKTFPTNDCAMCILSPKLVEVGRHTNINLHTLSEVLSIEGEAGDFQVTVRERPRYIDITKCIACGRCAEKCPKKVADEFNQGLSHRKAVYVPYPQAVPLKYSIDADNCLYFQKGKCRACQKFCPSEAVDYEQKEQIYTIPVGAVIMAPGFESFNPSALRIYGYGSFPNVITAREFERILSASGPFEGHLIRPSDHSQPEKIAWLQCVGSRNIREDAHGYCSGVCCMYAIKEAVIAKEHAEGELDTAIFFMDMRTHGKGFEETYNRARDEQGVRFIRARFHSIDPVKESDDLRLTYFTDDGELNREIFNMVVLSTGLEITQQLHSLSNTMGVETDSDRFIQTNVFSPVKTSRQGLFVAGASSGPKDIPQSVTEASSAAAGAGALLYSARNTLTKERHIPEERDVTGERPAIGVFICQCGVNIGAIVDVPAVRDYAATLPYVEFVMDNLYTCSQDAQESIAKIIMEKGLNRVVVAACTPKTHEPLFQETLVDTGLNKYVFEMTNIRNQCSWVHRDNPELATQKAKDLVRMAIAKVALMEPLKETDLEVDQRALVVGGGISGMVAAKTLSSQGYQVYLVERSGSLGGNSLLISRTWNGEDVQGHLKELIQSVETDSGIEIFKNTVLSNVDGFVGNFKTTLSHDGASDVVEHGVAIIATGGKEYIPDEYLYGKNLKVVTHMELDRMFIAEDDNLKGVKTAVFIQCVGSRVPERPYCSRVCCTHTMKSAIRLKEMAPDRKVFILYRDIRTYGQREELYKKARRLGVIFIRYNLDKKPVVNQRDGHITVTINDHILKKDIELDPDLLVLASGVVPNESESLAQMFKLSVNEDGFFMEAHAKLRPVDFATDGVFLAGMAHYPKPIEESIAQAQAAVSRAVTLLARKKVKVSGTVAQSTPVSCTSCGVCVDICPYSAPSFIKNGPFTGRAEINPALCKGCGLCVASCRSGALNLKGFGTDQIMAMITEL